MENRPKCHTCMAYSILLPHMYSYTSYPCTVALPGLADWSALSFADHVKSQLRPWDPWRVLDGR